MEIKRLAKWLQCHLLALWLLWALVFNVTCIVSRWIMKQGNVFFEQGNTSPLHMCCAGPANEHWKQCSIAKEKAWAPPGWMFHAGALSVINLEFVFPGLDPTDSQIKRSEDPIWLHCIEVFCQNVSFFYDQCAASCMWLFVSHFHDEPAVAYMNMLLVLTWSLFFSHSLLVQSERPLLCMSN